MSIRKQTQVLLDVTLILDETDKDSEEIAQDRLATALYNLDDYTFDIRGIHQVQ